MTIFQRMLLKMVTLEFFEWVLLKWADEPSSVNKLTTTKAKTIIKTLKDCEVK